MASALLSGLNPEQQHAASHTIGPMLVLAGAGTGKTSVITHRITYLLEQGIEPSSILAMTFTRKAASEMKERVGWLVGKSVRDIRIGTFHSLALKILRDFYAAAGLPEDFTVGGEDSKATLTFDSLLEVVAELLSTNPKVRQHYQKRFRFLLVDEYQDTNEVQFQILCSLLTEEQNLFVVGDDDQSIYAFNGASRHLILSFCEHFPGARFVMLTQNYRCSAEIVALANYLASRTNERYDKQLVANREAFGPIELVQFDSDYSECSYLCYRIEQLRDGQRPYSDFAVLVRSHAHRLAVKDALQMDGIPYGRENQGVAVQTLHSAKGLEFPFVFLPGLEDETLPHFASISEGKQAIEEERRLFYVGVTRAKERLVLSLANTRGGRSLMPSQFLRGLCENRLVTYQRLSS